MSVALIAKGADKGHIRWIPVEERVPEDRRPVLAWGTRDWIFGKWLRRPQFLGITRYNPRADDALGRFDCQRLHAWSTTVCTVTHWAEIVGP